MNPNPYWSLRYFVSISGGLKKWRGSEACLRERELRAPLKANMHSRDTEINRSNQVTIRYSFACNLPREWSVLY